MTISDKLNEIEERTRQLAGEAQTLESEKKAYEGLLECEVHDHEWKMESAQGNLREIHMIELHCVRCNCFALFQVGRENIPLPIYTSTGDGFVKDILPEEDE